jgi:lysozyme family protein
MPLFLSPAFITAFNFVLTAEGVDSNDPADPGGFTRFGIAQKFHPEIDVSKLTKEEAQEIYLTDYWGKIAGDSLPAPLALVVFDTAVQLNPGPAVRMLQVALGVEPDGVVGAKTLAAIRNAGTKRGLLERFLGARVVYYATRNNPRYFAGWVRRCFDVHRAAIGLESPLG